MNHLSAPGANPYTNPYTVYPETQQTEGDVREEVIEKSTDQAVPEGPVISTSNLEMFNRTMEDILRLKALSDKQAAEIQATVMETHIRLAKELSDKIFLEAQARNPYLLSSNN